ncbi:MAG: hypothetical protein J0M17_13425 [Planctomycetes bacterium]|nr:hypothetical protein [Planctomycetota bacterium]
MEDPNELPPGERVMPGKFESERLPNEGADPAPPKPDDERLPLKPAPPGVNERVLKPLDRGAEKLGVARLDEDGPRERPLGGENDRSDEPSDEPPPPKLREPPLMPPPLKLRLDPPERPPPPKLRLPPLTPPPPEPRLAPPPPILRPPPSGPRAIAAGPSVRLIVASHAAKNPIRDISLLPAKRELCSHVCPVPCLNLTR